MDDIRRPAPRPAEPTAPPPAAPVQPTTPVVPTAPVSTPAIEAPVSSEPIPTASTAVKVDNPRGGSGKLIATIVIGILVAGALIGAAFTMYTRDQDQPTDQPANNTTADNKTQATTDTTSPVTADDLDQEQKELESLTDSDNDKDLSEDGLSDDSLGL